LPSAFYITILTPAQPGFKYKKKKTQKIQVKQQKHPLLSKTGADVFAGAMLIGEKMNGICSAHGWAEWRFGLQEKWN